MDTPIANLIMIDMEKRMEQRKEYIEDAEKEIARVTKNIEDYKNTTAECERIWNALCDAGFVIERETHNDA